ncbi:MAG: PDZ domain-containing protein [Gemmatimonadaceae bacterium]
MNKLFITTSLTICRRAALGLAPGLLMAIGVTACTGVRQNAVLTADADAALRERLMRLGERDQRHRSRLTQLSRTVQPGVAGSAELDSLLREQALLDAANVDSLKAIFDAEGWPTAKRVGTPAALQAFLVVQHSPLPFQERMLPVLERAAASGDARPSDVAMLTDRVLMLQGKPQRYGSQLKVENGKPKLWPVEDEANVDARRAAVGLGSLASYLRMFDSAPAAAIAGGDSTVTAGRVLRVVAPAPGTTSAPIEGSPCLGLARSTPTEDAVKSGTDPLSTVTAVVAGSPAALAGLLTGDVIVAVGDKSAANPDVFDISTPGERLSLRIRRGGIEKTLVLVAGRRDAASGHCMVLSGK